MRCTVGVALRLSYQVDLRQPLFVTPLYCDLDAMQASMAMTEDAVVIAYTPRRRHLHSQRVQGEPGVLCSTWFSYGKEAPVVYIGQSVKRFEDPRLLTGQGAFLDDVKLPGMLHAAVLRSSHAHAHLTAIDTAAAQHTPGVVCVITADDLEGLVDSVPTRRETEAETLQPPVHPVLARGKVCYTGQPIAIVVAQDPYLVKDAMAMIQVEYAPLPPVIDPLEATQADAPLVHPELGTNIVLRTHNAGGDLEAALAQAEHVVRQRYRVQRLAPVPLETRGVLAHYQP